MTEAKQYFLNSDTEQNLCCYICKHLDFDLIDCEMSSMFIDNIADIGKLINTNPMILIFLTDVVYNGLMHFHNSSNDIQSQFNSVETFKEHYYIDSVNLLFIFNVVINHYKNVHTSKIQICFITGNE